MTQTGMTWRFTVRVGGASGLQAEPTLEQHLDELMNELLKLEKCNADVHDPSVGATLSTGAVEIELAVDLPAADEAVKRSRHIVRTAIHAAGGFTPRWDEVAETATAVEYTPDDAKLEFA
jgi:hypothetical protein